MGADSEHGRRRPCSRDCCQPNTRAQERDEADLHFTGNCLAQLAERETCEGCGYPGGRALLCRDWTRRWCELMAVGRHHHEGEDCGRDCESWWQVHTPERCRRWKAGIAAIEASLGFPRDTAANA